MDSSIIPRSFGGAKKNLRYSAMDAVRTAETRELRRKEVYDKILLRCLAQIDSKANEMSEDNKSLIFTVPEHVSSVLMNYDPATALEYLFVALRDDRGFTVRRVDARRLYVRWETIEDKQERIRRALAMRDSRPSTKPLHRPPRRDGSSSAKPDVVHGVNDHDDDPDVNWVKDDKVRRILASLKD